MKKHGTTVLLIVIFVFGIGLLLYPTVSNRWNSARQSKAIASYNDAVANMEKGKCQAVLDEARDFNTLISNNGNRQYLTEAELEKYYSILDITGTGIMAYIEIPSIDVTLPVYHGVSDSVLQVAVGHIEWSSLPVGGRNCHTVLSGHRGLPSAKLFTNLDKLTEGDIFIIKILTETIYYQVDQILIVEPSNTQNLNIVDGEDYCTLVTCTPYGINSHRLLVRGHRIENIEESEIINIVADATQIDPVIIAPIVAAPILIVLLVYVLIKYRRKKK